MSTSELILNVAALVIPFAAFGFIMVFAANARSKIPKRLEVRILPWDVANKLLLESPAWQIAPEEDHNHQIGWVWLERVEKP